MGLLEVVVFCALLAITFYGVIFFLSHTPRKALLEELDFVTTTKKEGEYSNPEKLPVLSDPASVELSVVVPCYNESKRLTKMLDDCLPLLRSKYAKDSQWEILIVDDGSTDNSFDIALGWAFENNLQPGSMRAVKLSKNRGKGGAVKHGMLHTRGKLSMFADADGASSFSDASKLIDSVDSSQLKVAIGSRAHMVKSDAVVKRTFIRNMMMYALHALVYIFGIKSIKDTQCGFKLFSRGALTEIFPRMHTERWIFDVEILLIALNKGIPIAEIPINWHEVDGSKIDLARDSILMAIDLVVIRFAYMLGIYKLN